VAVRAGSVLTVGRALRGARGYLAVAGGIAVAPVLGSRSTYLPAGFGGLSGRSLRAGDALPLAPGAAALAAQRWERLARRALEIDGVRTVRWSAPSFTVPEAGPLVARAMTGQHFAMFDETAQRAFFEHTWKVSPDSNRMGYRLAGVELTRAVPGDILSGPTCLGTVQVPANGSPIVLMADHQTTGGYPKIAEVAGVDVPRLAQLGPGAQLRFACCTLEEALELARAARARLSSTMQAIAWGYGS
jgi:antagonist of KipI